MTGKGFALVPEFDAGFSGKGKGSGAACVGDVVGGANFIDDAKSSVILDKEGAEEGIKNLIEVTLSSKEGGSGCGRRRHQRCVMTDLPSKLFLPSGEAGFPTSFSNKMTFRPCRYTDFRLNTTYSLTQRREQTVPAPVIEFSAPATVVHPLRSLLLEELIPMPPAAATSHGDSGLGLSQGVCPCPSPWDNWKPITRPKTEDEFEWVQVIPWPEKVLEEDGGVFEMKGVTETETEKEKAREEEEDMGNTAEKVTGNEKVVKTDKVKDEGVEKVVKEKEVPRCVGSAVGGRQRKVRRGLLSAQEAARAGSAEFTRVCSALLFPGRFKRKRSCLRHPLSVLAVSNANMQKQQLRERLEDAEHVRSYKEGFRVLKEKEKGKGRELEKEKEKQKAEPKSYYKQVFVFGSTDTSEVLFQGRVVQVGEGTTPPEPVRIHFLHRLGGRLQIATLGEWETLAGWASQFLGKGTGEVDGYFTTKGGRMLDSQVSEVELGLHPSQEVVWQGRLRGGGFSGGGKGARGAGQFGDWTCHNCHQPGCWAARNFCYRCGVTGFGTQGPWSKGTLEVGTGKVGTKEVWGLVWVGIG